MSFTDKTLTCLDCSTSFTFTASEQEFSSGTGCTNEAKTLPRSPETRDNETEPPIVAIDMHR